MVTPAQRPPLVLIDRTICEYTVPQRCRRQARWSIDGVHLCDGHREAGEFGRMFGQMARPIVVVRP